MDGEIDPNLPGKREAINTKRLLETQPGTGATLLPVSLKTKKMNEHDRRLVQQAIYKRWEEIDEDEAETPEGKAKLHEIAVRKYHHDEYLHGIL